MTVKAAYRNGGKSVVYMEADATFTDVALEVERFLRQGAILVEVDRR